ncbi:MAG: hypothetical protein ABI914_07140 [Acidobacteriota bacterium]
MSHPSVSIERARWTAALAVLVFATAMSGSAAPGRKKPPSAASATASAAPKVEVSVESLLDRRTTADFPHSSLTVSLVLQGEDARAVKAARPRVTRAVDDTGRSVAETSMVRGWQEARGDGLVTPQLDLGSPSRKAKVLTAVEGAVEMYLPSRDPAATVNIDRILSRKDKPLAVPALASLKVRVRPLSKAGLEREKKEAEAKKKAQAGKKKKDGVEGMAEGIADMLVSTIESLFSTVGENDLILKVDDPGEKIFSFELAAPDGTPISSYATTNLEGFRIIRMFEPIPASANLLVRLKTSKSFAEIPFSLADVKLP